MRRTDANRIRLNHRIATPRRLDKPNDVIKSLAYYD
jgi:hypothetical protein